MWEKFRLSIISGEPDTLRGVSPVRGRVFGNLSQKCENRRRILSLHSSLKDSPKEIQEKALAYIKQNKSQFSLNEVIDPTLLKSNLLSAFSEILKKLRENIFPTYISCFSSDKDSLSQWRAYGDNGYGVAIGFGTDALRELENITFHPVYYHNNIQKNIVSYKILEWYINPNSIIDWAYSFLPTFKSLGFKDEKEWRLIYIPQKENEFKSGLFFRNCELNLYYELPINENFISQIILGPKCNIKPTDLIIFLKKIGISIGEDRIVKSELSYR